MAAHLLADYFGAYVRVADSTSCGLNVLSSLIVARKFDPDNLSVSDVLKLIAPLVTLVAVVVLVARYALDYIGLIFLAIIGFGVFLSFTLPKRDAAAIAEAERKLDNKIGSLPVAGPIVGLLWRILKLLGSAVSTVLAIWIVYWAISDLL